MIKGGGYIGARTRHAQTIRKDINVGQGGCVP
jgi:hypothetical protein